MSKKDYNEIKNKFNEFVETWKTKEVKKLDRIIDSEIECYLSIVAAYADGSQHSKFGVKSFVRDFPKSDQLHTRVCNFVCKSNQHEAQQSAEVVGTALSFEKSTNKTKSFEFTAIFSNHWIKKEKNWMIDEMRMDVCSHGGDIETFTTEWFFEDTVVKTTPGLHYPCISGELDSPWNRIKDAEDYLTEEEKIEEAFSKYNFGVDNLAFDHVNSVLSEDLSGAMPPWGPMNKRHYLECLKYHRQKDRYWAHPVLIYDLQVDKDIAKVLAYRMAGHKQRKHPYVFTKDNATTEHACGRYEIEFKKIDNDWQISKWVYFLGIIELGPYES
ncbi:nuclear transport factor 2 family protein [Enterococcus sp. AZ072]|uniref:nuclear transport factor 2 family protein n=1 Tax=unclassified Enterococcus TaxID=2608891 RepID=UPI003D26D72A